MNSSYGEEEKESIREGREKGKWQAKEEWQHGDNEEQVSYFLLEVEIEVFCITEAHPLGTNLLFHFKLLLV